MKKAVWKGNNLRSRGLLYSQFTMLFIHLLYSWDDPPSGAISAGDPFWDGDICDPFSGCKCDLQLGDKKVMARITCFFARLFLDFHSPNLFLKTLFALKDAY